MASLICLTLLSVTSYSFATPLSTAPYTPRNRADIVFAPLHAPSEYHQHNVLNNSYIVVFKDDVPAGAFDSHFNFLQNAQVSHPLQGVDDGLNHVWDSVIKGYSGRFSDDVVNLIRGSPEVAYVEHDQLVHTMGGGETMDSQKSAPWGLARISHRPKLTFGTFSVYEYDTNGGEGVNAYVIDTGVYIDHEEFEGRARWGHTVPKNDQDIDGNGHGTHCAGTIASRKYGVAKAANIIAVKVLGTNGSGSMSDVVAGVVWAANDAVAQRKIAEVELRTTGRTKHRGSVANMSLGGGKSAALDDVVNKAVKSGLHFAVAAGNDNRDACDYSPAAAERAVTVGASTLGDERAYFSNYGHCVDVFAPGLNILSTWNRGPSDRNTISGTSMASPHTAGLLAYLLAIYPSATFDPSIAALFETEVLVSPSHRFVSIYETVYEYLPSWAAAVLPAPALIERLQSRAPLPELSPIQLKKALINLATKDVLLDSSLPQDTPNILIFNNATDARGRKW